MKTKVLSLAVVIGTLLLPGQTPLWGCSVCHSKNPKMVKMHAEPRNKACFECHGRGRIRSREELPAQMAGDPLCIECHGREANNDRTK